MKHTITAYVHYEKPWDDSREAFKVYPFDMSSADQVLIGKQQIEVEVPDDFNPVPAQIEALEQQKASVRAKAARDLMAIDDRIGKLLALPFTAATAEDPEPTRDPWELESDFECRLEAWRKERAPRCQACDGRGRVNIDHEVLDDSGRTVPGTATCEACNGEGSTS